MVYLALRRRTGERHGVDLHVGEQRVPRSPPLLQREFLRVLQVVARSKQKPYPSRVRSGEKNPVRLERQVIGQGRREAWIRERTCGRVLTATTPFCILILASSKLSQNAYEPAKGMALAPELPVSMTHYKEQQKWD